MLTRQQKSSIERPADGDLTSILKDGKENNLTASGCYIKGIEVNIAIGNTVNKFSGSIRYEKPSKYLIALKTRSGIEFSRIYINEDSLYILDRLKHNVYKGALKYIKTYYGIPAEILPVIIGDIVGNCSNDILTESKRNVIKFSCFISGIVLNYEFDKSIGKIISVKTGNRSGDDSSILMYDKFVKEDSAFYPGRILITNEKRKISAEINIKKIQYPWNEKIEFSIGNKYEIIELL